MEPWSEIAARDRGNALPVASGKHSGPIRTFNGRMHNSSRDREGGSSMKGRWKVVLAALGSLTLLATARPLRAQDVSMMSKQTTLWVDQKTGQVFIRPGRGREPITFGA